MKTIKEVADEIGVSKTAVRKKIENLDLRSGLQKSGNQFLIDEVTERLIKTAFVDSESKNKTETSSRKETETVSNLVSMLKKELDAKNEQIERLQKQVEQAHKLIDQEQQLNARNQQKIEMLENNKAELLLELAQEREILKAEQNKGFWDRFKKVRF